MARKKDSGSSVNLDSFLDIMTCLVGVLVLIIILTGLDAAQIRVLIPTPMQYETDKRPIFIEARNNELFRVPVTELQEQAEAATRQLVGEAGSGVERVLAAMQDMNNVVGDYQLDLTYIMVGQYGARLVDGASGYRLDNWQRETAQDWFGRILADMDKETEMLSFLVRDDSFEVFKIARHLAWVSGAEVGYELLPLDEPIRFGMLGQRVRPQ